MPAEKTLEELVPEIKDKVGFLRFLWGINAGKRGERLDDYVHVQRNFQLKWTSKRTEVAISELNGVEEPLMVRGGSQLIRTGCSSLLIYGGYKAGIYMVPHTKVQYGAVVEEVPSNQVALLKRALNFLTGQRETKIRRTKREISSQKTVVIPTLDQVITIAEKSEDPFVLLYSHLYDYGRGPMASNNFIVTGEEIYQKILHFCQQNPEQVQDLYLALAELPKSTGRAGKIGFTTIKNWRKNRNAEMVYDCG